MFFWLMTYVQLSWEFGRYMSARRTVGQDRQKCKETSSPLADKQQKTGEHVEKKNSLDTKLNFMFSEGSPIFCVEVTISDTVKKVRNPM